MPNSFTEQNRDMVLRHDKDLYHGNGKRGLTTRMDVAEDRMDRIEKKQDRIGQMFWAIIILLVGAIVTGTTDILIHAQQNKDAIQHSFIE